MNFAPATNGVTLCVMSVKFAADDPVEVYVPALDKGTGDAAVIARLKAELASVRARLAEVELLADRDPLAPVLNRRAFLRELHRTIAYCQRYGAEAALVFFDLDGFKAVNDTYGHAAGDAALRVVAATLAAHVRESDVVGRLGGDEFGVILAQADRAAAEIKAASLVDQLEAAPVIFDGRTIRLGASFGVRPFEKGLDAAQMMAEADAAMFIRKGERRAARAT
jgi:diguanylate cyclase (GGDEF)-like protein